MAKKPHKQNRMIGYITLAVGFGLLVVVAAFALMRTGHGPQALQGIGMSSALRQEWQTDFKNFHAIFQTDGNTFQILAVRPPDERYFSRGTFTLDGSRMKLTPDDSLGEPQVANPAQKFTKLTYQTFSVILKHSGDNLVWTIPPADPEYLQVDPAHPLIQYSGEKTITWTPKMSHAGTP